MTDTRVDLGTSLGPLRLSSPLIAACGTVGSVTDFEAYYPPRMAMTVHWYAANEGFHAIPPGYGLPWGTAFPGWDWVDFVAVAPELGGGYSVWFGSNEMGVAINTGQVVAGNIGSRLAIGLASHWPSK